MFEDAQLKRNMILHLCTSLQMRLNKKWLGHGTQHDLHTKECTFEISRQNKCLWSRLIKFISISIKHLTPRIIMNVCQTFLQRNMSKQFIISTCGIHLCVPDKNISMCVITAIPKNSFKESHVLI